jgi:hypothetical protein
MPNTTHVSLLDDLRQQLRWTSDGNRAESWIDGGELYLTIRLCLLARDRRRDTRHGIEAEDLFARLVAEYARRGEYAAVSRGQLIYHAPGLAEAVATLES